MALVPPSSRSFALPLTRAVPDGGTQLYGVPGAAAVKGWQAFFPGDKTGGGVSLSNTITYAPFPLANTVTVTQIIVPVEAVPASDGHLRCAILPADHNLQPTGSPVLQTVIAVAHSASPGEFTATVSTVLTAGVYLFAIEADQPDMLTDFGFGVFPNTYVCDDLATGQMLAAVLAPHVYGTLADPLPKWTVPYGAGAGTPDNLATVGTMVPFFMRWTI